MIDTKCIRVCGVTTPVTTMGWFPSPCMCTTTGTTVTGTQRAEEERGDEGDRRPAE
jgi:hypothetical protein